MGFYRSTIASGGGDVASYTATVNGEVLQYGSCAYLFAGNYYAQSNFNQPVVIGNNVRSCQYMFYYCNRLNQPVTIGENIRNCYGMFTSCDYFNQPVIIPDNVEDCSSMFYYCNRLNQPVTIGKSVRNCVQMFYGTPWFGSDIYIKGNYRLINCQNMLSSTNNNRRKNIWCKKNLVNQFTGANIVSGNRPSWSRVDYGNYNIYYNTTYNIYIYDNYEG